MIKSFYRFILIAFTLPLVMVSCHDEEIDDGMPFQMILRIPAAEGEAGGTRGMTRADGTNWTPDNPNKDYNTEGEGEGLDYYITGKDLKLLFCLDDVIIDFAEPSETRFVTAQGGFYEFFVKGKLNRIKSGDDKAYDVVVLANTKGLLHFDQEYLSNLVGSREDAIYPNLIFDYKAETIGGVHIHDIAHTFTENNFLAAENDTYKAKRDSETAARVPMWGRVVGQQLNEGTPVEIPLMRSLAKIRIALDPAINTGSGNYSYQIDSITMVGASTRGTLMPKDAHHKVTSETVPNGSSSFPLSSWWPDATNAQGAQNIPEGTEHNHLSLKFYKKTGKEYGTNTNIDYFYTYVPETINLTGQFHFNVYLSRTLKSENSTVPQHFRMEFGKYTINNDNSVTGKYMPVMRNHYYMYTIKGIAQDQLIFINPWDVEILPPIMM